MFLLLILLCLTLRDSGRARRPVRLRFLGTRRFGVQEAGQGQPRGRSPGCCPSSADTLFIKGTVTMQIPRHEGL